MKKIIYLLFLVPTLCNAQSRVGISNSSPTEKLHIDSGAVKIGKLVWTNIQNNWLKFGDGDYVQIGEQGDDSLYIRSKYIRMEHYNPASPSTIYLKGNLILDDGTQGSGRVLTSTGFGGTSEWKNLPSFNSGFNVNGSNNAVSLTSANSPLLLPFDLPLYDPGNNFDESLNNYKYIVPETGFYHFDVNLNLSLPASVGNIFLYCTLIENDLTGNTNIINTFSSTISNNSLGGAYTIPMSVSRRLISGESVYLSISSNSSSLTYINLSTSNFSGFRVY